MIGQRDFPVWAGVPKLNLLQFGPAAWYDLSNPSSRILGTGDKCEFDLSGNSAQLAYCNNGQAANYLTATAKSVTGNQTFSADCVMLSYTAPAANRTLASKLAGNSGFEFILLTTGILRLRIGDGATVTNVDAPSALTATALTRHTLSAVWVDGVGATFQIDGGAIGAQQAAAKTLADSGAVLTIDNTSINGQLFRVQVGTVYDCYPNRDATKMAASWTSGGASAEVYTLTTAQPQGGRIAGQRDQVQLTASFQSVLSGNGLLFSGAAYHNMQSGPWGLAQPSCAYFVGTQITWGNGPNILDGYDGSHRLSLAQHTSTPNLNVYAGSNSADFGGMAVGVPTLLTVYVNGAISFIRANRGAALTINPGTQNAQGITIGGTSGGASSCSNILLNELAIFSALPAQDALIQQYFINKWHLAA